MEDGRGPHILRGNAAGNDRVLIAAADFVAWTGRETLATLLMAGFLGGPMGLLMRKLWLDETGNKQRKRKKKARSLA